MGEVGAASAAAAAARASAALTSAAQGRVLQDFAASGMREDDGGRGPAHMGKKSIEEVTFCAQNLQGTNLPPFKPKTGAGTGLQRNSSHDASSRVIRLLFRVHTCVCVSCDSPRLLLGGPTSSTNKKHGSGAPSLYLQSHQSPRPSEMGWNGLLSGNGRLPAVPERHADDVVPRGYAIHPPEGAVPPPPPPPPPLVP